MVGVEGSRGQGPGAEEARAGQLSAEQLRICRAEGLRGGGDEVLRAEPQHHSPSAPQRSATRRPLSPSSPHPLSPSSSQTLSPSNSRPASPSAPQHHSLSASSSATTIVSSTKPIVLVPGFLGPGAEGLSAECCGAEGLRAEGCGADGLSAQCHEGAAAEHEGNTESRGCEARGEGAAWYQYWGEAMKLGTEDSPVVCAWPSGLGSLWDRACELFFQIKGGIVDYGQEHSERFGHNRFGRRYPGLFPEWSAASPIHLVGHSLGGTTIRMLQHLLSINAFEGFSTSADWVLSITSINAPHNGSLAAYALGEKELSAPAVMKLSPGHVLGSLVHILAFLNVRPLGFDISLDHWCLSYKQANWLNGLSTLIHSLLWKSKLVEDEDNAAYDASIHAMRKWNREMGAVHPHTFYISLVGDASEANSFSPEASLLCWNLSSFLTYILLVARFLFRRVFLNLIEWLTYRREYADLQRLMPDMDIRDYKGPSDGLCTVFSQRYPAIGLNEACASAPLPLNVDKMKPAVWYVERHGQDHMGLVPFAPNPSVQHHLFGRLFARLRQLQQPMVQEALSFKVYEANELSNSSTSRIRPDQN